MLDEAKKVKKQNTKDALYQFEHHNFKKLYCNFSGSYTVYPYVNGSGIDLSWGDWSGSGYNRYCPMYITCTSSGYGTITLTNSYNIHKIIIFVTGS